MRTKAETGVMLPQAQERQRPRADPEKPAERSRADSPSQLQQEPTCRHLDLELLASRTGRQ